MDGPSLSNRALIKRLLALTWQYRAGCIRIVCLQLVLLTLGLAGLSFTGVGIDFVRFQVQPGTRPPAWPFGLVPPATWRPVLVLAVLSASILGLAVFRALLNYVVTVQAAKLVQRKIVVELRAHVYDKLQRLSFRFFDENASGSIINRVTRDVQGTRMFVDMVMMQSVVMILSLIVYAVYMVSIHLPLTVVCLLTTPLLGFLSARFSRLVRPAYMKNRELVDDVVRVLSENMQGHPGHQVVCPRVGGHPAFSRGQPGGPRPELLDLPAGQPVRPHHRIPHPGQPGAAAGLRRVPGPA